MQNEYQLQLGQIDVDKEEAKSPNIFIAGWRPAVGWVGALALAYEFLFRPIVGGIVTSIFPTLVFVGLDTGLLQTLLFTLLGANAARSYEKIQGVDTKAFSTSIKATPTNVGTGKAI